LRSGFLETPGVRKVQAAQAMLSVAPIVWQKGCVSAVLGISASIEISSNLPGQPENDVMEA